MEIKKKSDLQDSSYSLYDIRLYYLSILTNLLNMRLLRKKPKNQTYFPPAPPNSSKQFADLSRILNFCSLERNKIVLKEYNKSIGHITELIDILSIENSIPDGNSLFIDINGLYDYLVLEPEVVFRIDTFFDHQIQNLCHLSELEIPIASQHDIIKQICSQCVPRFDPKLHYFEISSDQEKFSYWLFSPQNALSSEISAFIGSFNQIPRKRFLSSLLALIQKFKTTFPLTDYVMSSVFIILFYRSVFDIAMSMSPQYFYPKKPTVLSSIVPQVKCSDLMPPENLLPRFSHEEPARQVFQRDINYSKAGNHINYSFFHNNPMDALYEIHKALEIMQIGISQRSQIEIDSVLPFETTFSIFFGSMLTSDIPNLEELVEFILDFGSQNRWPPEFQYAQVTLVAALAFFDTLKVQYGAR